jgi:type II secretory pathway pseudopilin PulG
MEVIKMRILNHKGFSVLEAIASVFIISLVFVTAFTVVVAMRNRAIATEEKRYAVEAASSIRDEIVQNYAYSTIAPWILSGEKSVDYLNCSDLGVPIQCSLFDYEANNKVYDDNVEIIFLAPSADSINYKVIHFTVTILYYKGLSVTLEGIIYE